MVVLATTQRLVLMCYIDLKVYFTCHSLVFRLYVQSIASYTVLVLCITCLYYLQDVQIYYPDSSTGYV